MIKVLVKTFSILEAIVLNSPRPMRISVLAEQFDINNGTCARIIRDLVEAGYLIQISRQDGYAAGPRALTFANAVSYRTALLETARPIVEEAARRFSASVLLTERQGEERYVLLHQNESPRLLIQLKALSFYDLFDTATGLMLSAFSSEKEQGELLANYAKREKSSLHPLFGPSFGGREQLAEIRRNGRAVFSDISRGQGIAAFPVFRNDTFIAALGGSIPVDEFEERGGDFTEGLSLAAEEISRAVSVIHTTG